MKGCTLLRRERPGRCGGRVALYVRKHLEFIEFCLGVDDEQVEHLRVRIKGQYSQGDIVGVFYRPPDKEEEMDEVLWRQLEVA